MGRRKGQGLSNLILDIQIMLSDLKNVLQKLQISLTQRTRTIFMVVVTFGLIVLTALTVWTCLSAGIEQNTIVKYQYVQKAKLDYKVFLKPNPLYEQGVLEMGQVYPSLFVNYLQPTLTYEFNGDKPANVKGNYSVVATVAGVQTEEKKEKILWSKDFQLVPKTDFNSPEGKVKLEKELSVSYDVFNQFADEVQKVTEIVSNVFLSLKWHIQVEAENEDGLIMDELTPKLIMPLGKKYFEITGDLEPEKTGAIEEQIVTQVPINKNRMILLNGGIAFCLLALLYLWRFVKVVTPSLWEEKVKEIFKKHGERLVGLEKEISLPREKIIGIKSIDDMVLLADELCRPIYYFHRTGFGDEALLFYVLSENKVYTYQLEAENTNVLFAPNETLPFL
ncbi:MAG: DUF5305 domain-containing protein [Clostridia bacterium]|jgi:hypothetical protein|nr:DUF5305 domain-containing protein [Clostridia bacterium]